MSVNAQQSILFQRRGETVATKFGFRNRPAGLVDLKHAQRMPVTTADKQCRTVTLKRGEVASVRQPGSIQILSGVVWLTGTPADEDVILVEGETFSFKDCFPFVMEGLAEAEIAFSVD